MSENDTILFISDLHLSPDTPVLRAQFEAFLAGPASRVGALYILGDLFDYWVGDDMLADPWYAGVADTIRDYAVQGRRVAIAHGNRDFLLGEDFFARSASRLLPDPYVLSVPAWQFVLTHGDVLCTDDTAYQQFRRQVRDPAWQHSFLAQPLAVRIRMAEEMRSQSQAEKGLKAQEIMDVAPGTVEDFLRDHGYATLIHGHTHRPATHDVIVDGIHCQRCVLSDWRVTASGPIADYLLWDGENVLRHAFPALAATG